MVNYIVFHKTIFMCIIQASKFIYGNHWKIRQIIHFNIYCGINIVMIEIDSVYLGEIQP